MRKGERGDLAAQVNSLAVEAEANALKLELIEQIVKADPEELERIEKALRGELLKGATQPGAELNTIFIDDVEEFSHQLKAVVKKKGYTTLADLARYTEAELRERSGFQNGSIDKIRAALAKHGHTLE